MRTRQPIAVSAASPITAPRPGRQPSPTVTAPPTASGASSPTPAATALASLSTAGPAGPWWSVSTAVVPFTIIEPATDASAAQVSVAASGRDASSPAVHSATPPTPAQTRVARPNRRTSHGRNTPPATPPTASAVPCRLATPRLVCCSSRSSGTTGAKPYRK